MNLAGVAAPLVATLAAGTGHAGAGPGGIVMAHCAGAASSPVLAGRVARSFGFAAAFVALAIAAALGCAGWTIGRPLRASKPRYANPQTNPS